MTFKFLGQLILSFFFLSELLLASDYKANSCLKAMSRYEHELDSFDPKVVKAQNSLEKKRILIQLWNLKIKVRKEILNSSTSSFYDQSCSQSLRKFFNKIRYFEDINGLFYLRGKGDKITGLEKKKVLPIFSRGFPWSMSNQGEFKTSQDLKTGDIIMWRSATTVSGAIARLGDIPNHFSHLSIIYKDPQSGKIFNVESLMETGLTINEWNDQKLHSSSGISRIVVLRHENTKLSKEAGKFAFYYAKKNLNTLYDFQFNLNDHTDIFCSELIRIAFEYASDGNFMLPRFQTKISMTNRKFLKSFGANVHEGFQPGDIELDSKFNIIAEWRNFHHAKLNLAFDSVFSKIYEWMDKYGYEFKWSFYGNLVGSISQQIRNSKLLYPLLEQFLPENISKETITAVVSIDLLAKRLYGQLKEEIKVNDFYDLENANNILEEIRKRDLKQLIEFEESTSFEEGIEPPVFHLFFAPESV